MTENHAQNRVAGDTGDTGGIFSNEGGREVQTNNEDYYEHHNATNYYGLAANPTKADLERHGL